MVMKYKLYCLKEYQFPNWLPKQFRFVADFTEATWLEAGYVQDSLFNSVYYVFDKNIHKAGRQYYFINNEDRIMFLLGCL
jgi:hypothetical protein